MEPVYKDITPPPPNSIIYTSPRIGEAIQMCSAKEWEVFFRFIRLNLQDRIASNNGDDLIKLQGKIDNVADIESLFQKIVKKPVK